MRRWLAGLAIQAGLWLGAFALLAAVLRRPLFAAGLVLATHALLVLVDRAKRRALREPLVFADLGLFTQALRFPRLYLPYFGWVRAIVAALAFGAVALAGLALEPPVENLPWLLGGVVAVALLAMGTLAAGAPALQPDRDVAAYGMLASLWLYWLQEWRAPPAIAFPFATATASPRLAKAPHVVAVEAESFFDPRRIGVAARLEHFDRLRAEGQTGRLAVPAWGAYTMRTEFAFLSGVANEALGVHRFNPYRRLARQRLPTLASLLKAQGYRTVCVHPYPAAFFRRDRIFPELGFDAFLDLAAFDGAAKDGPFVADREVGRKVIELLRSAGQPHFVFAITMESHGPFWLEGRDELAVYLRHLANTDAMLGELAEALRAAGDGVLCAFGDHLPGLPQVFQQAQTLDCGTDYLVWKPRGPASATADLGVEQLGQAILDKLRG
jgi:hypothetical protein